MDFFELVAGRESIRSYDPQKPLSHDVLAQILEAGRLAPSAANRQPWRFIVVSSEAKLAEIRSAYTRPWFSDAPHVLIIVGNKEQSWKRSDGYNSIETDLTIAADHLILAAESLGIGTCWIGNFDYEIVRSVLELNNDEVVFVLTPLGYPQEGFEKKGTKVRKAFDEVVKFI
jgi:nitroreductase